MTTGNKFFLANACCIPFVITLSAPYWYYALALQLSFLVAQVSFDIRDARRRNREMKAATEEFFNNLRKMSNGQ